MAGIGGGDGRRDGALQLPNRIKAVSFCKLKQDRLGSQQPALGVPARTHHWKWHRHATGVVSQQQRPGPHISCVCLRPCSAPPLPLFILRIKHCIREPFDMALRSGESQVGEGTQLKGHACEVAPLGGTCRDAACMLHTTVGWLAADKHEMRWQAALTHVCLAGRRIRWTVPSLSAAGWGPCAHVAHRES